MSFVNRDITFVIFDTIFFYHNMDYLHLSMLSLLNYLLFIVNLDLDENMLILFFSLLYLNKLYKLYFYYYRPNL